MSSKELIAVKLAVDTHTHTHIFIKMYKMYKPVVCTKTCLDTPTYKSFQKINDIVFYLLLVFKNFKIYPATYFRFPNKSSFAGEETKYF